MATSDPLIGRQLGDYKIEGLIGHGGMARVYRGFDEKLERYAAVKVIEPTLIASGEEEEYRDRFLREARSIARLSHPNIVGVYQFAQEENLYFIAMAFLDGRDLREILKENAEERKMMSQDVMIKILRDIANGLDYAHKNDIIHRDVKPSNIIVTNEGNAILTDFGLALNAVEGTIGNTFGSVHYIAPEQAISSAQAVPQSDQYSLGVIVYELLAGQVPFDDASAMSVALKHISDPPPPIRDLNSKVSPILEAVVMRALDKEPNNRYEKVIDFIDDFAKALEDAPDALEGESISQRPVNLPPASPSMDDDAPTISDTGSRPGSIRVAAPPSTQRSKADDASGGNKTIILVVAVVVIIALIAGGLFMANSAAQATAATETAVANEEATALMVAQNSTATEGANIANTETAVANEQATETAIANENATSTAAFEATETQVANENATSTAVFEATETEIANQNATATVEFENTQAAIAIANENATSTAAFEATETEIANAIATNEAATVSAQETSNAVVFKTQTQEALVSSTPTPTLTPSATNTPSPTPTLTPSPTNTFTPSPTPSPTTIALVSQPGEEQLLLRYDGRSILLTNRSQDAPLFVNSLVFTKFVEDEDGEWVSSDTYRLTQSSFADAPSPLPYQSCLQIWDGSNFGRPSPNNDLMNDTCETTPYWRTSTRVFWADETRDSYFEVSLNGVDVLGKCQTNILGSLREMRCVIKMP